MGKEKELLPSGMSVEQEGQLTTFAASLRQWAFTTATESSFGKMNYWYFILKKQQPFPLSSVVFAKFSQVRFIQTSLIQTTGDPPWRAAV